MSLRKTLAATLVGLTMSAGIYAQQSQSATPQEQMNSRHEGQRKGGRHGRMGRPGFGLLRELNLTEEQRQQQRAIVQRRLGNTKAQREELFKLREKRIEGTFTGEDEARAQALRKELHDSMSGMGTEIESILTADQRARLEQLKTERRSQMKERRGQRRERRLEREAIPQ